MENGIYSEAVHPGENKYLSHDITNSLNALLFKMGGSASTVLPMQAFNVEKYTYDNNNNLVAKTTCYGTIEYEYDAENRLVSSGANGMVQSVTYKYDAKGNLLLKTTPFGKSEYRYNAENRMSYSEVIDEKTKTFSQDTYGYDAFGRRIISSDVSGGAVRTLYDGFSFDVVKKSPMNLNGQFADYGEGAVKTESSESQEYRYYYGADASKNEGRSRATGGADFEIISDAERTVRSFISLGGVPLVESDVSGGASYYGTDVRGSIRSASDGYGEVIGGYDYDVFGNVLGDVDVGYGYCGKARSRATGLYDYGFRDYDAGVGRFTTMDPIRDGVNWFGYCGGDAVNWVDLWGLTEYPGVPSQYHAALKEQEKKNSNPFAIDPHDPNGSRKFDAARSGLGQMATNNNQENTSGIYFLVARDMRSYDISTDRDHPKNTYLDKGALYNTNTGEIVLFDKVQTVANYPSTDPDRNPVSSCFNDTVAPGFFDVKLYTKTNVAIGTAGILANTTTIDGRKVDANGYTENPLSPGRGLVHSDLNPKTGNPFSTPYSEQCFILPGNDNNTFFDALREWGIQNSEVIKGLVSNRKTY